MPRRSWFGLPEERDILIDRLDGLREKGNFGGGKACFIGNVSQAYKRMNFVVIVAI